MRILVAAIGSAGDVHPFLAIGRELNRRGHDVHVFASAHFEEAIRLAGLEPVAIGSAARFEALVRHPDAFHPRRGFGVIARAALGELPQLYRRMDERVLDGETLAVGSSLALAVRLIQEKRGVPSAMAHLAPSIFRSAAAPPLVGSTPLRHAVPAALTRLFWRAVDGLYADPMFCPALNRFREEIGLRPVHRVFDRWIHDADLLLGLFPDWFAPPLPDWPPGLQLTGFPLGDGALRSALPEPVEAFLEQGPPPVVFTAGTAMASAHRFFAESADACRLSSRRGLLLTRYPEQLPCPLPDGVLHFELAAFSELLPRAAAIVHHGGIGTAAQALAAATPQIVRPVAFDQHDNAARLRELGVSRTLPPKRYRASTVAEALDALTGSASVKAACARAASKMRGGGGAGKGSGNGAAEAAEIILRRLR